MKLPEFTYHVIAAWPDGEILTAEHPATRFGAFEAAAELIQKNKCEVRIEVIERNPETGGCLGVSDVTALFMAEYDMPASPLEVACECCGRNWCQCDAAYDERACDAIMEAAE